MKVLYLLWLHKWKICCWYAGLSMVEFCSCAPSVQPMSLLVFNLVAVMCGCLDFYYGRLFNQLVLLLGISGVLRVWILSGVTGSNSLLGTLTFGGCLLLISLLSHGGMGAGDIKFGIAAGVWLGPWLSLVAIYIAFIVGAVYGIGYLIIRRKSIRDYGRVTIPFGPFLALGGSAALTWGQDIIELYLDIV